MGGMARVFRAEHDDGHIVAIKVLHSDALQTEERARFEREFETLKGLSHPNVVTVHEAGVSGGTPWLLPLPNIQSVSVEIANRLHLRVNGEVLAIDTGAESPLKWAHFLREHCKPGVVATSGGANT